MTPAALTELRKAHWLAFCYVVGILISIAFPIAIAFLPLKPDGEAIDSWIQRSGTVMVVFALLAEFAAINLYQRLNPSFYPGPGVAEARKIYRKYPVWMSVIVLLISVTGALINSYGDIIYQLCIEH